MLIFLDTYPIICLSPNVAIGDKVGQRCTKHCIVNNIFIFNWRQFHQHCYTQFFCTNVVSAAFTTYMQIEKAPKTTFVRKIQTFNVDEIDSSCAYQETEHVEFPSLERDDSSIGREKLGLGAVQWNTDAFQRFCGNSNDKKMKQK